MVDEALRKEEMKAMKALLPNKLCFKILVSGSKSVKNCISES
jgi:hypothetical protein